MYVLSFELVSGVECGCTETAISEARRMLDSEIKKYGTDGKVKPAVIINLLPSFLEEW